MKTILLYSGWNGPLYWLDEKLVNTGPVGQNELPISNALRAQLQHFNRWHEELCHSDSGAPTLLDQRLYDERGAVLWEELQRELGSDYRVLHPSHEFERKLEDCSEQLRAAQKREPYA